MTMNPQIISFRCVMKDALGKVISYSINQEMSTQMPPDAPLKGLLKGLQNLRTGERRQIRVSANEAYGFYDSGLVVELSRKKVPYGEFLKIGDQVMAQTVNGEVRNFRVIEASDSRLTLDANHPLAGQDLVFDIEVTDAREATADDAALRRHGLEHYFLH